MSYMKALTAAGAEVVRYAYFGDYQGTILAEVNYQGKNGYVTVFYGSCALCDPYESFVEGFDWDHELTEAELAEFGKSYLDVMRSEEETLRRHEKDAEWDTDAEDMVRWIQKG